METYIKYDSPITFRKVLLPDIKPLIMEYRDSLKFPGDNFMAHLQSEANHYAMEVKGRLIGAVAIKDRNLGLVYIRPQYKFLERQILERVLSEFNVHYGFAQAWDYHMMNLYTEFHDKIENQAYQFQLLDKRQIRTPLFNLTVRLATAADEIYLNEVDFLKNPGSYIRKQEVWIALNEDGKKVGVGVIQPMIFEDEYLDIGMFTNKELREHGIGRSILALLMKIVSDSGRIPVAGCHWKNYTARRTLESAGMTCIGTIFKFSFNKNKLKID